MARLYGSECFIERLKLRDTSQEKYSGKKQYMKMKQLTYHHIKKKEYGGRATIENGAILSAENHSWFHKQPKEVQEEMNRMFQELKARTDECRIEIGPIKSKTEIHTMIGKIDLKKKKEERYNRAKEKRELRMEVEKILGGEER